MGMFDSVYIDIKCPYCGTKREIEAQTKELECLMDMFKKGDYVGTDRLGYLQCLAGCNSVECSEFLVKRDGYSSGFGRQFHVNIKLKNGIITGKYEIVNDSEE